MPSVESAIMNMLTPSCWDNPVLFGDKLVDRGVVIHAPYSCLQEHDIMAVAVAIHAKFQAGGVGQYISMGLDSTSGLHMDLQSSGELNMTEVSRLLPLLSL